MSDAEASEGKCITCKREWPQATFKNYAESDESLPMECDQCVEAKNRASQIDAKIDEVQGDALSTTARVVNVSGIESKTNLRGFMFATHMGAQPLILTTLTVFFAKGDEAIACYQYRNVPVVVCEAWYAAPSKGEYFASQIKNSYDYAKVK